MKREHEILKQTYDAEIHLIKSNPNTSADIQIYHKDITAWIGKAEHGYYLDIYKKKRPVFINATLTGTYPWETVLRELDRYLPIRKELSLF